MHSVVLKQLIEEGARAAAVEALLGVVSHLQLQILFARFLASHQFVLIIIHSCIADHTCW